MSDVSGLLHLQRVLAGDFHQVLSLFLQVCHLLLQYPDLNSGEDSQALLQ